MAPLDPAALSAAWLANPWLLWGVGPMASVAAGFFAAVAALELLLKTGWFDSSLLAYPSAKAAAGGLRRRGDALAATRARIPFAKQLRTCARIVLGPTVIANGASLVLLMRLAGVGAAAAWWPASAGAAVLQFVALAVIADFGLYWGHRIQHESEFLWKMHRVHHKIDTPSPVSTMYIHGIDATLQGGIPMALAAVAVRPAPAVLYLFFAAHVAENAFNHSGLDSRLVDLVCLKSLPFRARAAFHDAHHKYSNYSRNAKNYGESFWVWDALFGTSGGLAGQRQGAAAAAGAGRRAQGGVIRRWTLF